MWPRAYSQLSRLSWGCEACGCAQGPRVGPGGIGHYIPSLGRSKTQSKIFLKHFAKQNTFLARPLAQAPEAVASG